MAEATALQHLMERRAQLASANRQRLATEREKLERYFDYRERAAREKLASAERVFANVSLSEDPVVQRIIPVWAKNVENARRVGETLAEERVRRLAELTGRDQVAAQHQMLTAAYVTVEPRVPQSEASSETDLK